MLASAAFITPEGVKTARPSPSFKPISVYSALPPPELSEGFENDAYNSVEQSVLPWCRVLSNNSFGTLVTNKSLGFSWCVNSRLNKLTPWCCDATSDTDSEKLFLRLNGKTYNPIPDCATVFSNGHVQYIGSCGEVTFSVTVSVPDTGNFKRIEVELSCNKAVTAEICYHIMPIMGESRRGRNLLKAEWKSGGLVIVKPNSLIEERMLLTAEGGCDGFTCDEAAFRCGRWNDRKLGIFGGCAAIYKRISVQSEEQSRAVFFLAYTAQGGFGLPDTSTVCPEYVIVNQPTVNGIDFTQDKLFNYHLPQQILCCRILGRTGFYQNGGAWGFRDQLQDCMAAVYFAPLTVRSHILRAASSQFESGDVLHWWHVVDGRHMGTRTHYSDDFLWLPYCTAHYAKITGDYGILNVELPYLTGAPLQPEERERYCIYEKSDKTATLFEHCVSAIEHGLRLGNHGLPLMLGGDWNDGFNLVGVKQKGESVWLAMFLICVLNDFAQLCVTSGREQYSERLTGIAAHLKAAVTDNCWEDDRFLRGYYDDGSKLGSAQSRFCRIDSVTQAFSVLSDTGTRQQQNTALDTALAALYDTKSGLVRLFAPPFENPKKPVGYTADYPAGVRENGGQYTHAACWMAYALFMCARADEGWKLLTGLIPTAAAGVKNGSFFAEPFAVPADISSNPCAYGRSGWNLYTGAAGWYYRTVIEAMLGIRKEGNSVRFSPSIPSFINGFTVVLTSNGVKMTARYTRTGEPCVLCDGISVSAAQFGQTDTEVEVNY